jgi:holo-[acyl-carrier protein] synthase
MGSLLVGIDLVQISDVVGAIEQFGPRYLERVFTDSEIRYCSQFEERAAEHYASRFAAKEATFKVLRLSDDSLVFRSVEVRREQSGHCEIVLHGEARELAERVGIASLALSMSHEAAFATAVVVAELRGSRPSRISRRRPAARRRLLGYRRGSKG